MSAPEAGLGRIREDLTVVTLKWLCRHHMDQERTS
jgi:hypothetical protein